MPCRFLCASLAGALCLPLIKRIGARGCKTQAQVACGRVSLPNRAVCTQQAQPGLLRHPRKGEGAFRHIFTEQQEISLLPTDL